MYEEGPERDHAVVKWFNGVFVLALLPLTDVKKKWDFLKTNVPSVLDKPSIDKFIKYFESHYMTGSFSGTWNHFDTVGPKTNNHVEGYNLGLKKEDDHEKSPNIYKAVEMFKAMDSKAHTKYLDNKAKKPLRLGTRDDEMRRNSYNMLKGMRLTGSLNPDDYADEVVKLYMKADINHKTIEDEDIPQRLNAQQIENIIFNIDLLKIFT